MKTILLSFVFVLSAAVMASGQAGEQDFPEREAQAISLSRERLPVKEALRPPIDDDGGLPMVPAQAAYVRPDSKTRFRRYVKSMVGPTALGKDVLSAGFSTWRNSPEEWGDGWEGFGRRFASSFGKGVIKHTTIYALDETLKYDSRFYRSQKKDLGFRLGNALISPVTARNARGKRVIGIPRIVGTYTSGIVAAETWFPSRYDYKDGLKNGTVSLGINAAFNVLKEFVWKK